MAIRITEDGKVIYENEPDIDRELFPNLHCESGKSAYDQAVEGGYTGSEEDFIRDLNSISTKAPAIYDRAVGAIASFSDGADDMSMKSCVVNIEPIQEGTGDPSPENVRPISGRTGLSVVRTGKNVLKLSDWENENNSGITIGTDNISIINKGFQEALNRYNVLNRSACVFSFHVKTITLTASTASFAVYADGITKLVGSGTETTGNIMLNSVGTEKDIKLTVPNGTEYISFGGWAWSGEVQISNLQLELGSAVTDYEPYKGSTYPVNWETEAGTVYGGTLDIVSGKLTVLGVKDTLTVVNGQLQSQFFIERSAGQSVAVLGNNVRASLNRRSQTNNMNTISSSYNVKMANLCPHYFAHAADTAHWYINNQLYLYLPKVDVGETIESYRTFLQDNPFEVYIQFATPTEIQLTPQEVRTLLGENSIWSDGGNVEVEYPADTKMYIQRLTGSDEDDMMANTNIPDSTYFLISNTLYRSTTAIASGDPIVPGTNCTVTNIAEALNTLNTTT